MNNNGYFASMNTSEGFRSYFEEIFNSAQLDALYIIKGGSGTGKSTTMKKIGEHFEKKGFLVERFYCSSDVNSLDGIIIDSKIAVIDGTAPHTTDPKYPGAVDEIVNLSSCWDTDILKASKKEIIKLVTQKNSCYRKGYSFLSAAGKIKREMKNIVCENYKYEKMRHAVLRYIKQSGWKGTKKSKSLRHISSVGPDGVVVFKTFENMSDKICIVKNSHGCEEILFNEFIKQIDEIGLNCVISNDPICNENINAIFLPEVKTCIVMSDGTENLYDEKYKVFNMERFIDKETLGSNRTKLRFANKCYKSLIDGACDSFKDAKKIHDKVERIYSVSVDFDKVSEIAKELIERITNQLI